MTCEMGKIVAPKKNRRSFIKAATASLGLVAIGPLAFSKEVFKFTSDFQSKPWIELSKESYLHNAAMIGQMAQGKPVVAVLKNNAYGLGNVEVAQILDESPHLYGMAVVKDVSAMTIRSAGISKPILLMGDFDTSLGQELVQNDITLSVYSQDSLVKIKSIKPSGERPTKVALYIDTGLGRMGIPYQQTLDIAKEIASDPNLEIAQTFSTLTTPKSYAEEQIERFETILNALNQKGIPTGLAHLAPSYSLLDLPSSHQDAVRPGILLHGSFPAAFNSKMSEYPLRVTYRLKAPVIRIEKLKAGDTIGFSRFYQVEKDEWIATLPIGWADGYYSGAENGAKVLLGGQLHPVVNVNASHANISLGADTNIRVGDVATLIGPDYSEITPEGFSKLTEGHNYLQINYKESLSKVVYERF